MTTIGKAVPVRQGITLAVGEGARGARGTVMLSRDNHLSQIFEGTIIEALQAAERLSLEHRFEGYYDISGEDDVKTIRPTDLDVIGEINRQVETLRPKLGFSWTFNPSWSPAELTAMPAAQAHLSRLMTLRDGLLKKLSLAAA